MKKQLTQRQPKRPFAESTLESLDERRKISYPSSRKIQGDSQWFNATREWVENHDRIRYALKAFHRTTLWASMIDTHKVSRDLSSIKLDELFCKS